MMAFRAVYDVKCEDLFSMNAHYGHLVTSDNVAYSVSPYSPVFLHKRIRYNINTMLTCINLRSSESKRVGVFAFYFGSKVSLRYRKEVVKKFKAKGFNSLCLVDKRNGKTFVLVPGRGIIKCSPMHSNADTVLNAASECSKYVLGKDVVDYGEHCYFPVVSARDFLKVKKFVKDISSLSHLWKMKPRPVCEMRCIDENIARLFKTRKYSELISNFRENDREIVKNTVMMIARHPCLDEYNRICMNTLSGLLYKHRVVEKVFKWMIDQDELVLFKKGMKYRNFKFGGVIERFVRKIYKHDLIADRGPHLIKDFDGCEGESLCMLQEVLEDRSHLYPHVLKEIRAQFKWPSSKDFHKSMDCRKSVIRHVRYLSSTPMKLFDLLYSKYGADGVKNCSIRHVMRSVYNQRCHAELDTTMWNTLKVQLLLRGAEVSLNVLLNSGDLIVSDHVRNYYDWATKKERWDNFDSSFKWQLSKLVQDANGKRLISFDNEFTQSILLEICKDKNHTDTFWNKALFIPTASYLYNQQRYMNYSFFREPELKHENLLGAYQRFSYALACNKMFGLPMNPGVMSHTLSCRYTIPKNTIGERLSNCMKGIIRVKHNGNLPIKKMSTSMLRLLSYSYNAEDYPEEFLKTGDAVVDKYLKSYLGAIDNLGVSIKKEQVIFNIFNLLDRNDLSLLRSEVEDGNEFELRRYYQKLSNLSYRVRNKFLGGVSLGDYRDQNKEKIELTDKTPVAYNQRTWERQEGIRLANEMRALGFKLNGR